MVKTIFSAIASDKRELTTLSQSTVNTLLWKLGEKSSITFLHKDYRQKIG